MVLHRAWNKNSKAFFIFRFECDKCGVDKECQSNGLYKVKLKNTNQIILLKVLTHNY